jgi:hypothetical protein
MASPEQKDRAKSWAIGVISLVLIIVVAAFIIRECWINKPIDVSAITKEKEFWKTRADSFAVMNSEQQAQIISDREQFDHDKNKIRNAQKKFETMGLDSNVVFFLNWTSSQPNE